MPKQAQELKAAVVGKLTEPGLHFVGRGRGLALQVKGPPCSWVLRLVVGAARRDMGRGSIQRIDAQPIHKPRFRTGLLAPLGLPLRYRFQAFDRLTLREAALTFPLLTVPAMRPPRPACR